MNRQQLHIEEINRKDKKIQFQIRLPKNCHKVKGILTTINPTRMKLLSTQERGSLWLRIPNKRDVFYSDSLHFEHAIEKEWSNVNTQGISENTDWWLGGSKRSFFTLELDQDIRIIEGYYEDFSTEPAVNYQLRIYLEYDLKQSPELRIKN